MQRRSDEPSWGELPRTQWHISTPDHYRGTAPLNGVRTGGGAGLAKRGVCTVLAVELRRRVSQLRALTFRRLGRLHTLTEPRRQNRAARLTRALQAGRSGSSLRWYCSRSSPRLGLLFAWVKHRMRGSGDQQLLPQPLPHLTAEGII